MRYLGTHVGDLLEKVLVGKLGGNGGASEVDRAVSQLKIGMLSRIG